MSDMSSHDDDVLDPEDERGSEVEDFTSETPRPSSFSTSTTADYGAGDSIDVEVSMTSPKVTVHQAKKTSMKLLQRLNGSESSQCERKPTSRTIASE